MHPRDQYIEQLETQIYNLNMEIDRLRQEQETGDAGIRETLDGQLDMLEDRQQQVKDKVTELRNSGEDSWEDLKIGVEDSITIFSESVKSAISRFVKD